MTHDFTKGPIKKLEDFDLGWSTEFLEHIEEQYLDNVFNVFKKCKYVVITHALPGDTKGHHHVNLQSSQYWIDKFKQNGFTYDEQYTIVLKTRSDMHRDFMRKTGKFFTRNGS